MVILALSPALLGMFLLPVISIFVMAKVWLLFLPPTEIPTTTRS